MDDGRSQEGAPSAIRHAVATLNPGYFALVMATGMVSVGMHYAGLSALSTVLMWIDQVCYVVLVLLYGWRAVAYRRQLLADLADPASGFGFFTFVAATNVVGTRLFAAGHPNVSLVLLAVACVAWLVLGYAVPWAAMLGRDDRPMIEGANGTWFIWVVASQSIAVLAATLQPENSHHEALGLLAVFCWSVGIVLYAIAGCFVAARLMLFKMPPAGLTPPYWVAMGACAITVLAGARIAQMANAPSVVVTHELVTGVSFVFWAFGTWLIPALIAAGWWRHIRHKVPMRYDAGWWGIVFPLAMYAAASHYFGYAEQLPVMRGIGHYEVWLAVAAWLVTFIAMLRHVWRTAIRPAGATLPPTFTP